MAFTTGLPVTGINGLEEKKLAGYLRLRYRKDLYIKLSFMFNSNIDLIKILIICNFLALLGGSLVIIFFNLYKKNSHRVSMPVSNSMLLVMSCYAACIVAFTIVPLPYSQSRHDLRASINVEPVINTVRTLLDTSREETVCWQWMPFKI
jgi:hypothetical protein